MAILGHFEASVCVNGTPTPEYEDKLTKSTETRISKYIQVMGGANFSVVFTVKKEYTVDCDYLRYVVYFDGNPITSHICDFKDCPKNLPVKSDIRKDLDTVGRSKFSFGKLTVSELFLLDTVLSDLMEIKPTSLFFLFSKRSGRISELLLSSSLDA
jgi:hypothetical protein